MNKEMKILSTAEAAKRLGITRQGLAYLVKAGRIRPVENIISRYKFFSESELYRHLGEK